MKEMGLEGKVTGQQASDCGLEFQKSCSFFVRLWSCVSLFSFIHLSAFLCLCVSYGLNS